MRKISGRTRQDFAFYCLKQFTYNLEPINAHGTATDMFDITGEVSFFPIKGFSVFRTDSCCHILVNPESMVQTRTFLAYHARLFKHGLVGSNVHLSLKSNLLLVCPSISLIIFVHSCRICKVRLMLSKFGTRS